MSDRLIGGLGTGFPVASEDRQAPPLDSLNGARGLAEDVRHLPDAQLAEGTKQDDAPLARGEAAEDRVHPRLLGGVGRPFLGVSAPPGSDHGNR